MSEAAQTEAAIQELMHQLANSKSELEARAADVALQQSTLERSAAGLHELEATLGALSSSASAKAAEDVDVLLELQNTLASRHNAVTAGSADVGKSAAQVRTAGTGLKLAGLEFAFVAFCMAMPSSREGSKLGASQC